MATQQQQQQQQSVDGAGAADDGLSVGFTGELTVAFVLVVFVLFLFVLILYLRAKRYAGATATLSSRSRRLVFAEEHQPNLLRRALDPAVLASLPITVFHLKDFDDGGLECAVCLSELEEGEKARVLPKCKHGFHLDCIDMWFHSNSTCPLCRSSVGPLPILQNAGLGSNLVESSHLAMVLENGQLPESSNLAGSSSSGGGSSSRRMEGMLVIDIPRRAMEAGFSSPSSPALLSSKFPVEYIKTPTSVRLRSLSRMLSRGGSRAVGSSCSPGGYDTEQGVGASSTLPVSKAS